jgi:hypothetical protein
MEREDLRKLIVAGMVISGAVAAILMYRRGESLFGIARKALTNPVGSLISEVETAVSNDGPNNQTSALPQPATS